VKSENIKKTLIFSFWQRRDFFYLYFDCTQLFIVGFTCSLTAGTQDCPIHCSILVAMVRLHGNHPLRQMGMVS